jgi:hypothetical protein
LVYASAATTHFGSKDLEQLLASARNNNTSLDVSGILLFQDGTFFQVLEGYREDVEPLYEKIGLDPRHDNVLLLANNEIEERNFGDWSMGFVCNNDVINSLPGFVDFFKGRTFVDLHGDSKRMRQVLDGFRRGRWRRQCESTAAVS